jgi:hypothetical protein
MSTKTAVFVEKLKSKINEWDEAFDHFQIKEYPTRLLAQALYREQVEVLAAKRRLVEERLSNFKKRMQWPR